MFNLKKERVSPVRLTRSNCFIYLIMEDGILFTELWNSVITDGNVYDLLLCVEAESVMSTFAADT